MNKKYTVPINLNDNWGELNKREMEEFKRNIMLDSKYKSIFNIVLSNMFKSEGNNVVE